MSGIKRFKKIGIILLILSALIIILRFYILPKIIFPQEYGNLVEKYSEEFNLDKNLVFSLMKAESSFDPLAVSRKETRGLMQIAEGTGVWGAKELELKNYSNDSLFNPETNIKIGCWYLEKLLLQYGNTDVAIAAYNAGSGNVSKWLKDENYSDDGKTLKYVPYKETRGHISKINFFKKIYDFLYGEQ